MSDTGENFLAALVAVAVHLAIVAILIVGVQLRRESPIIATNVIEGTLVDGSAFADEIATIELEQAPVEVPEEPPEPEVDDSAEREAELERQRLEEEQRQQELAERKREQDDAERKRQEELAEQLRVQEAAERKRLEEEARLKAEAEAEAKRQAEEEARKQAALEQQRKREEAERKRREEDEARKRVQAEIERKEREAAMKQEELEQQMAAGIAAEERRTSAIDAGLLAVYLAKIRQKIQRYWRPPPFSEGATCVLRARQLRTGDIVSIESVDCGGNAALERSLEAAVNQASPLPTPDDPSLFDPNLRLEVNPDS